MNPPIGSDPSTTAPYWRVQQRRVVTVAYGLPPISYIGYPVPVPCIGHAGLGFREATAEDGPAIRSHLLALSPEDRQMRFCAALSDAAIAAHAEALPKRPGFALAAIDGPLWNGPFHQAGPVHGFAELVVAGRSAELGISVDASRRRAGVGTYLMQTAARLLALRGVEEIVALTLNRNAAMIRLGLSCGARVERDDSDVIVTFSVERLHQAYLARRTAQVLTPRPWRRRASGTGG
jgi:GNAT superfamily N-acetyltransferase